MCEISIPYICQVTFNKYFLCAIIKYKILRKYKMNTTRYPVLVSPRGTISRIVESMENNDHRDFVKDPSLVGGYHDVRQTLLNTLINTSLSPTKVANTTFNSLLLFGVGGVGKTTLVKCALGEAEYRGGMEITVLEASLGAILASGWDTEKVIKGLLTSASEKAPAVLFFDDMDTLIPKESCEDDQVTVDRNKALSKQLCGLLGNLPKGVCVIGATKRPHKMDFSVVLKFQQRVYVRLPSFKERVEILRVLMGDFPDHIWSNVGIDEIADLTHGCSVHDIRRMLEHTLQAEAAAGNLDPNTFCSPMFQKRDQHEEDNEENLEDLPLIEEFDLQQNSIGLDEQAADAQNTSSTFFGKIWRFLRALLKYLSEGRWNNLY